jgi:hypothetical protein
MIHALVLVCLAQSANDNNPLNLLDAKTVGKIMAHKPIAGFIAKAGLHAHVEAGPPAPLAPLTFTDFKAGPRLLPAKLAKAPGVTADEGQQLTSAMNAAMDGYERTQRKANVASAVAWLLFNAIDPYTHLISHLTDAEGDAAVAAVNDELAASDRFRKMSVQQRQELYESCLATAASLIGAQKAHADDDAKKRGREIIEVFTKP